ncbi:MAG: hypothetical protein WCO31_07320, partial [Actinomycetes bacterium]
FSSEPSPEMGVYPDYRLVKLNFGFPAGGSNGARWAQDDEGRAWIVKTYRGNVDRVATELVANRIYGIMRARVPIAGLIRVNKKAAIAYPALVGEVRKHCFQSGEEAPSSTLGEHYMVDALLANWDFVGLDDDNILWDPSGNPVRLDQGGTFEFRAMGEPKEFGPVPTEVTTLMSEGQAKRAVSVTTDQMQEEALRIRERLSPEVVAELVAEAPFADEAMRERISCNLIPRVAALEATEVSTSSAGGPSFSEQLNRSTRLPG